MNIYELDEIGPMLPYEDMQIPSFLSLRNVEGKNEKRSERKSEIMYHNFFVNISSILICPCIPGAVGVSDNQKEPLSNSSNLLVL